MDKCINCGYCPHCGRSDKQENKPWSQPVWIAPYWPWYPVYPNANPGWTILPNITYTTGITTYTTFTDGSITC